MPDPAPEQIQAFLENLVAVEAKHGLCMGGYPWASVERLDPMTEAVSVKEDLSVAYHDADKPKGTKIIATATYPTTAHARLSAAARVAALRAEVAP